MKMQKIQFRIGELASQLKVEKFVIRFWEKEFNLSSTRSEGGPRFYSAEDLDAFAYIKGLLYDQGFTIAGAKKKLADKQFAITPNPCIPSVRRSLSAGECIEGVANSIVGSQRTTIPTVPAELVEIKDKEIEHLKQQLSTLKKQLSILRDNL